VKKSDDLRGNFIKTIESYPQHRLYYVDECGIDKYLYREYGYSPKGRSVIGKVSGRRFKRTDIVAPLSYKGSTDSILFEYWLETMHFEAAPAYSVFAMDNASFHRKTVLRELAAKANCEILFLPPYSPDLNPIEKFWAWLKQNLKSVLHRFSGFDTALMDCFRVK